MVLSDLRWMTGEDIGWTGLHLSILCPPQVRRNVEKQGGGEEQQVCDVRQERTGVELVGENMWRQSAHTSEYKNSVRFCTFSDSLQHFRTKQWAYTSSTQIQEDRDKVVSVHTQSITALSSVRKGTRRNLHTHISFLNRLWFQTVEACFRVLPSLLSLWQQTVFWTVLDSPLEQEEVEVVVALCQEVSQNTCWVTRSNLIGRQTEVNTFDKIPELSHQILIEAPGDRQTDRELRYTC